MAISHSTDRSPISICRLKKIVMAVDPGVCRFTARVTVHADGELLHVAIESACSHVKEYASTVEVLDMFEALKMPFSQNILFTKGM